MPWPPGLCWGLRDRPPTLPVCLDFCTSRLAFWACPVTAKGSTSETDIFPSTACIFITKMKAGCPGVRAHIHAPPIHHPCLLPQSLPYILIQLPAPRGIGLQGIGDNLCFCFPCWGSQTLSCWKVKWRRPRETSSEVNWDELLRLEVSALRWGEEWRSRRQPGQRPEAISSEARAGYFSLCKANGQALRCDCSCFPSLNNVPQRNFHLK